MLMTHFQLNSVFIIVRQQTKSIGISPVTIITLSTYGIVLYGILLTSVLPVVVTCVFLHRNVTNILSNMMPE